MHSFRIGGSVGRSLARTVVDDHEDRGSENGVRHNIGATTGASAATSKRKHDEGSKREHDDGSKRDRDSGYATAIDLPLSPAFRQDFVACKPRSAGGIEKMVWMRHLPHSSGQPRKRTKTQINMGRTTAWGRRPNLIQCLV